LPAEATRGAALVAAPLFFKNASLVIGHLSFINCHLKTFGSLNWFYNRKPEVFNGN